MNLGKTENADYQKVRKNIGKKTYYPTSSYMSMGIDQEEKEPDDVDIKDFLIDIFEKNKSEVNDLRDSLKIAVREFQSERKRYQNAYVSIVKSSREREHYKYSCYLVTSLLRWMCFFFFTCCAYIALEYFLESKKDWSVFLFLIPILVILVLSLRMKGRFDTSDYLASITSIVSLSIMFFWNIVSRSELPFSLNYIVPVMPVVIRLGSIIVFLAKRDS